VPGLRASTHGPAASVLGEVPGGAEPTAEAQIQDVQSLLHAA